MVERIRRGSKKIFRRDPISAPTFALYISTCTHPLVSIYRWMTWRYREFIRHPDALGPRRRASTSALAIEYVSPNDRRPVYHPVAQGIGTRGSCWFAREYKRDAKRHGRRAEKRNWRRQSNVSRPRAFSALSPTRAGVDGHVNRRDLTGNAAQESLDVVGRGAENRCVLNTENANYAITSRDG